jgi:hypothetical protein
MTGATKYLAGDKEYQRLQSSIEHVESNGLEKLVQQNVINLWREIEEKFKIPRKKKQRR